MKNTKLLVVVDESPATKRALEYVAQVASRRRDFRICLAHALPSPPPDLVEFRAQKRPASVHISADGFRGRDDGTASLELC